MLATVLGVMRILEVWPAREPVDLQGEVDVVDQARLPERGADLGLGPDVVAPSRAFTSASCALKKAPSAPVISRSTYSQISRRISA